MTGRLFSHGKLILLGEYAVLHGSNAVCLPLATGQDLFYTFTNTPEIQWKWSYSNQIISSLVMDSQSFDLKTKDSGNHVWVKELFRLIREQNPQFLIEHGGELHFVNYFPIEWGLGSSSATISSICRLARVNPYIVNQALMGGSGADIASTTTDQWFLYRKKMPLPEITKIPGDYLFKNHTCFVYSGQKQQTASHLKKVGVERSSRSIDVNEINHLVERFVSANDINELYDVISKHEKIISEFIDLKPIGSQYPDFKGMLKSLGAWGGDFFMAVSSEGAEYIKEFFIMKGYINVFTWNELVNSEKF
jgi:mevalonate kinase